MGIADSARLTVAAFMECALYDPANGYYARAAQRSGRAGDFFTSVDVGPLFGELLELQIEEMSRLLQPAVGPQSPVPGFFDLVEAGAETGAGQPTSSTRRAFGILRFFSRSGSTSSSPVLPPGRRSARRSAMCRIASRRRVRACPNHSKVC